MTTRENLQSCIEKCTLIDIRNTTERKSSTFYFDSRLGTVIDENEINNTYKNCMHFDAKPVYDIKNITRRGNVFAVQLLITDELNNDNFSEVTLTVKYFDFDKSFVVRKYDPTKIIRSILIKYREFFIASQHPYYKFGYIADYENTTSPVIHYENTTSPVIHYESDKHDISHLDEFELYANMLNAATNSNYKNINDTIVNTANKKNLSTNTLDVDTLDVDTDDSISIEIDNQHIDSQDAETDWCNSRIQEPQSNSDDSDSGCGSGCNSIDGEASDKDSLGYSRGVSVEELEEIEAMFGTNTGSHAIIEQDEDEPGTPQDEPKKILRKLPVIGARNLMRHGGRTTTSIFSTDISKLNNHTLGVSSAAISGMSFKMFTSELESLKPFIPKLDERKDNLE